MHQATVSFSFLLAKISSYPSPFPSKPRPDNHLQHITKPPQYITPPDNDQSPPLHTFTYPLPSSILTPMNASSSYHPPSSTFPSGCLHLNLQQSKERPESAEYIPHPSRGNTLEHSFRHPRNRSQRSHRCRALDPADSVDLLLGAGVAVLVSCFRS